MHEAVARFEDDTYRAMALVAYALEGEADDTVAGAAHEVAQASVRLNAQSLALAARQLVTLGGDPVAAVELTMAALARAFAEVELDIRTALEREVPLFI